MKNFIENIKKILFKKKSKENFYFSLVILGLVEMIVGITLFLYV
ncbi:hypothetical protein [Clostridium neonatale]|nr:hypothetical protein [Clostridium neonatale]CAI3207845.1 hypothetical protein CNEO2_360059 [Clostridium neonatale]